MNAENGAGFRCLSGSNPLWIYISLFMEIRVGVFTLSINLGGPVSPCENNKWANVETFIAHFPTKNAKREYFC